MFEDIRIEIDLEKKAAYHMQRDEELALIARDDLNFTPILRLYSWKPYSISLGYQQKESDIDKAKCDEHGIDIIRRPTGGRAVYHAEELTYAVILRADPSEGIYAVHNQIAEFLLDGLQELTGGKLSLTGRNEAAQTRAAYQEGLATNVACFTSISRHEITAEGKKVVGSAQRRFGSGVLQHGSILLGDEHLRLPELLSIDAKNIERMKDILRHETTTISEICGKEVTAEEAAEAIVKYAGRASVIAP